MARTAANKSAARRGAEKAPAARTRKTPTRPARGGSAIRTYRQALAFLNTKTNYEKMVRVGYNHTNFNLSRMSRILAELGNPHKQLRMLHVAGTKGKGSTCYMLAGMLQATGRKVGMYTSPHLIELRERISVNGDMVSEAAFTRLIAKIAPIAQKLEKEGPTFFELMTAAAFLHFVDEQVDFAVVETGLGGRLDSTNVIKPEVVGITSISYDHMHLLGNTLPQIAEEKAGIFKPGIPAVTAPQPPEVIKTLKMVAERVGCELRVVADDIDYSYRFEVSRDFGPHSRVCMLTKHSRFDHVRVPLLGEHQALNCGVALGMLDCLRRSGEDINEQVAIDGLEKVRVPGRLEMIQTEPRIVVDAAHNGESVACLMRGIGQNIGYDSMVVIFACAVDKDIDGMLSQLQLGADKVIFTSLGNSRSADPAELLQRFQEQTHKMAQVAPTLPEAYQIARHCVGREDLICITGSVYLVGEAKKLQAAGGFA